MHVTLRAKLLLFWGCMGVFRSERTQDSLEKNVLGEELNSRSENLKSHFYLFVVSLMTTLIAHIIQGLLNNTFLKSVKKVFMA